LSRPVSLDPDGSPFFSAAVRLIQGIPVEGYPDSGIVLVELTFNLPTYDEEVPEEEFCVVLRGEHAWRLGRMLVSAGHIADEGENRTVYDRRPP
jgi:hypothetical protein